MTFPAAVFPSLEAPFVGPNGRITAPWYRVLLDIYARTIGQVGTMVIWPISAAAVPGDFLECDGSAVSRTTYANLFQLIGTTFGPGDGSTTFNLPTYGADPGFAVVIHSF